MSCEEYDMLIHGYLDGELDLLSTLRLEAHLPECASLRADARESPGVAVRHEQRQALFQASK